jgi:hypothetical protein
MTSSYRIGDIIVQGFNDSSLNSIILKENPNTIGSDYILSQKNMNERFLCATRIVLNHIQKYLHLYPKDIQNSTVVHLRLGDSMGDGFYEKRLRPLDIDYYKKNIPNGKVYVIGKCHFEQNVSSPNYDECKEVSNKYMQNVLNALGAIHFDGGHADIDLCCAVIAKKFVQGRGYYSQLIVEIRRHLGLKSIETYSHIFENMTANDANKVKN